jgi:hypothetical protein
MIFLFSQGTRFVINIADSLNEDAFRRCEGVPAPVFSQQHEKAEGNITTGSIIAAICNMMCCCKCWC